MTYRPISVALIFVTVLFAVTDASQAKTFAPATFEGLLRIVDAVAIADVTALKGLGSDEMTDVAFCIEVGKRGALHLKHGTHE